MYFVGGVKVLCIERAVSYKYVYQVQDKIVTAVFGRGHCGMMAEVWARDAGVSGSSGKQRASLLSSLIDGEREPRRCSVW